MSLSGETENRSQAAERRELHSAIVRFAGDSGDGIQVLGGQFSVTSALAGNDLETFPDFPAEIRAPTGSVYGVSAYQIHFGSQEIKTIGDRPDVLVVFNPAALRSNLSLLRPGGMIIADKGGFTKTNLRKASYETSPLEDDTLDGYTLISIDISTLTRRAVEDIDLTKKQAVRCKNFFALGFVFWLYDHGLDPTKIWLDKKFVARPIIAEANKVAMDAGHALGETLEASGDLSGYHVPPADMVPGTYRAVTGAQAMAWGLAAAAELSDKKLVFASYPITPASPILHALAQLKDLGVVTFQAEDEIAAMCATIGASYAGALGVTSSSGPGIALKMEAIGLGVAAELPAVIVNSQRAGPSTGMPTKTEQSDLYQAVYGRNGDAPIPVLAARTPADCFDTAIEAARIAMTYMTPVMLLTDGFITNAAEPWHLPDFDALPRITLNNCSGGENFEPFRRDVETLARAWVVPGTPEKEYRIGGLERDQLSGEISYDPDNHQNMTELRREKVLRIAGDIPELRPDQGPDEGDLAVVGWGSTYGPISRAVGNMREKGHAVSHVHLRYLFPFAKNQCDLMARYNRILVPEMNMGQLITLMRDRGCPRATGLSKVTGRPFLISELEQAIAAQLNTSARTL